ncbi:MAG: trypsin-like peptidase domain-containing protein [Aestuariibacter sp.]
MSSWLQFLMKSVLLGVILSATILVLLPEMRTGNGFDILVTDNESRNPAKISFNKAINAAAPAVVNIYSTRTENRSALFRSTPVERTSLGSGVIMSSNGYILTCLHVIKDADYITVGLSNDRIDREAQLVGYDAITDLAVLKVNAQNLPVIPQLEQPKTEVGDLVLAIGNPFNLGQTITQGVVSATGRSDTSHLGVASHRNFIQMDAALNEGNSGGALVDSNGNLVGITNAVFKILDERRRVKDVPGVFFAVPYTMAKKVMDSIISNGRVIRGYLGIEGGSVFEEDGAMVPGFLITNVTTGSPADEAGLRRNDLLLSVNGEAIQSSSQVLNLVAETKPGNTLTFAVDRENEIVDIPVVISELPNS